jgi:hypothetical protein
MLVRLRSTSIALLGVVTAVGLALVVFISQIGFPGVFSSPLPGNPPEVGKVHHAIALTQAAGGGIGSPPPIGISRSRVAVTAGRSHKPPSPRSATDAGVGGSRLLAESPGEAASPAPEPTPAPASEPTVQPPPASPPPPASAPQPASTPISGEEGTSSSKSAGSASAKAANEGTGPSDSHASGKSGGRQASKSVGHSGPPSKSSGYSAGKHGSEQSDSTSKPVPTAPGGPPPAKEASGAPGNATGKESPDDGSSGKSPQ